MMKWKLFGFGVITGATLSVLFPYLRKGRESRFEEVDRENHETDDDTSPNTMEFAKECREVKDCIQKATVRAFIVFYKK